MTLRNQAGRIYDDDLWARLDAVMARARRFLHSTRAIRARTFTPICRGCQQAGRTHVSPPTYPQRYVCVNCRRRWIGVPNFG